MRRFTFFLGVFSVGLVVFLLLTGQFQGTEETFENIETEPPLDATEQNHVVLPFYDYSLGRLRFTLRGLVDLSSGLVLSPGNLMNQSDLLDASIEMPVYAAGRTEPIDKIMFEAQRVTYPGGEEAQVVGDLRVIGAGGSPEMRTRDMVIRWADGEDIRIEGHSPVQVTWPELKLYGSSGMHGSIGSGSGLNSLSFSPPLIIAMKGMVNEDGVVTEQGLDGAPGRQIRVLCNGPTTLKGAENWVRFDGGVQVFEAQPDDPIVPHQAAPPRHIFADYLDLHLEPTTRRLVRIQGSRRENPITIYLGGGVRVEGNQLHWQNGEARVRLSQGVLIHSDLGTFEAQEATVLTQEGRCIISGGVSGKMVGQAITTGSAESQNEALWQITAEDAEFQFEDGQLLTLTARAAPGQVVVIEEQHPEGARIEGEELRWLAIDQQIEVFSTADQRALFSAGNNRIEAKSAALSIGKPRLVFAGGVQAQLVELPTGPTSTVPKWLGENPSCVVEADQLTLQWDAQQRLKQLDAVAGEEPLSLQIQGTESLRLHGSQLQWRGIDGVVRIEGEGRQQILLGDRAELTADRLRLSLAESQASGEGTVEARIGPSAATGSASQVMIGCDEVVVSLATDGMPDGSAEGATEISPGSVIAVRALGHDGRKVEIDDGTILARCEELLWDAVNQRYRFQGKGLQQVEVAGEERNPDIIEAQLITLDPVAATAQLQGQATARVYLGNASAGEAVETDRKLAWNLSAERIDAKLDLSGEQIRLVDVEASNSVQLQQPQGSIEFRGQHCHWDQLHQRLVLSSQDGQGLQTFVRGTDPQDEVVAREVVMVRSTVPGKDSPERLEVLLSSVLSATFQLDPAADKEVGQFQLRTDEMLLVLREPLEGGSIRPHEVLAWGSTDLRGGPYRILAERARVLLRNRSVELEGGERQPVQVLRDGTSDLPPSRSVKLTWGSRGYRVESLPRGGGWSIGDIDSALERMDRKDHRP
ncbi:MAG TPA: hypothetical protein EYQ08_08610 [Planctomycetes bacterium]|nr:hypothetical protein [Planctomycetota bacterium]HIK82746.1 hypothetical protein [Planctomycetota bacterium]